MAGGPPYSVGMADDDVAEGPRRRRVIEWDDPFETSRPAAGLAGIDYLRGLIDGTFPPPPMGLLMGMDLVEVEVGRAVFTCLPDESHYNTIGIVHGGLVCTLLDSAAGCAVQSTLPAGVGYTSIDLNVSYLRPLRQSTGRITVEGRVLKPGRRVAFTEGRVTDEAGTLLATATSSLLIFPLDPPAAS